MSNAIRIFACSLLLMGSANAFAQQSSQCPSLPPDSNMHWADEQAREDYVLCKGALDDGRIVLNVMLTTSDPGLSLKRELRAEKGSFAGESMHWYRPDVGNADAPELALRRIAVIDLGKRHYAQIWIDAGDTHELAWLQQLTIDLDNTSQALAKGQ